MSKTLLKTTESQSTLIFNAKTAVLVVVLFVLCFSCDSNSKKQSREDELNTISFQMQEQEEAWNNGDLEAFMQPYWKSDSLRFIGKSGLNRGWKTTLENYQKSYQNKQEMGTLKFSNKSLDFVGERTIFVVGEWKLSRADSLGDLGGMYSLIWEKKNGEWVITTDHSS